MEMTGILVATMIVGGVGLFVGLFLGVAAIKFKVDGKIKRFQCRSGCWILEQPSVSIG